jgi:hypothetical protein
MYLLIILSAIYFKGFDIFITPDTNFIKGIIKMQVKCRLSRKFHKMDTGYYLMKIDIGSMNMSRYYEH